MATMPISPATRGLFLSVIMPMGMPETYMPRFADVPYSGQTVRRGGGEQGPYSHDDVALGRRKLQFIGELGRPC